MDITGKKIGIWGLGIVGTALVQFLSKKQVILSVYDKRPLTVQEQHFLVQHNTHLYDPSSLNSFLKNNDILIASPGVDLLLYEEYAHKCIAELDLFSLFCTKPIIAVTGSVGKTTTTALITQLFALHGISAIAGGNIGIASFDLLQYQPSVDWIILEVSSFQLEHCRKFAPDIALITNFYPNHLDRHKTAQQYLESKARICAHQSEKQHTIVHTNLYTALSRTDAYQTSSGQFHAYCAQNRTNVDTEAHTIFSHFFADNAHIVRQTDTTKKQFLATHALPSLSFIENWIGALAALDIAGILLDETLISNAFFSVPEHRLEKIATLNDIDFYNDSKSTLAASTIAALNQLQGKPITLLLGGTSKGVDRSLFIRDLQTLVHHVVCFGGEKDTLKSLCDLYHIAAYSCQSLEEAFAKSIEITAPGGIILLSPAGASYDLFKNFEERGARFKQLVQSLNWCNH